MNDLTRALCESMAALAPSRAGEWRPLPASDTVARVTETLRRVLFPGYFGTAELTRLLTDAANAVAQMVKSSSKKLLWQKLQ